MNTLGPAIMILGLALSMAATADDQRVIVRPTDTGEALINPDIGSYGLWGDGHTFMSSQVPDDK